MLTSGAMLKACPALENLDAIEQGGLSDRLSHARSYSVQTRAVQLTRDVSDSHRGCGWRRVDARHDRRQSTGGDSGPGMSFLLRRGCCRAGVGALIGCALRNEVRDK